MYAIITTCIFELQVLGDLMMCILFYFMMTSTNMNWNIKKDTFNTLVCAIWFSVIMCF